MPLSRLFPTLIYRVRLPGRGLADRRLLDQVDALRLEDAPGRRWSQTNYPGGYTSYGSLSRLHRQAAGFAELERAIRPHARRFVRALHYDMRGRTLLMTDCWASIMAGTTMHGSHLHPLSFISGTYYLRVPPRAAPIKFEDPRLDRLMAVPPRRKDAPADMQAFHAIRVSSGELVMFESWLRHEVPASAAQTERVSVSFNYAWAERAR